MKAKFSTSKVDVKMLPPLECIISSGFSNRGRGVFFDFNKNSQVTLSGRRELSLLLRLPKEVGMSFLTLRASGTMENEETAFSSSRSMVKHSFESEFDIAFYVEGLENSEDLKKRADDFANSDSLKKAEAALNQAIERLDKEKKRRTFSSPPEKFRTDVARAREALNLVRTENREELRGNAKASK